jgi:hypothetical protein
VPAPDDRPPDDRRLIVALSLVGLLFVAQAGALARQLVTGYRPFGAAPTRVPLSWDMFATHIERCEVSWDPPLLLGGPAIQRLSAIGRPFEWFVVRSTRADYRDLVRQGCQRSPHTRRARLDCWLPDGTRPREELDCR